jgi:putative NADPH-quinone reductase
LTALQDELTNYGHQSEILDLYAEAFNPVLSGSEWEHYETSNSPELERYSDQLRRATGLIWVFPTWNYGLPAILKGYIDRVWKPNIAFRIDARRNLHFDLFLHIKFFIAVTTFGGGRLTNTFLGNPCKRVLTRCLRRLFTSSCQFTWLALYALDKPSDRRIGRFLLKVRSVTRAFASHVRA